MAVAVTLSITLEGESGMRDSGDSGGHGASVSVAVAVEGISRPLGNVDGSNRVGPVVAGCSIAVGRIGSDGGWGAVSADGNGGRGGRGSISSSKSRGASGKNSAISGTVTSVAVGTESSIAIRAVVGISLSLPLGDVTSTNGISNVVAGSSVAIGLVGSNSLHTVSTISTVSSVASVASISDVAGVPKTVASVARVAQAVAVGAVIGVGLSGGQGQATSHNCKSEHLPWQAFKKRIPM